MLLFIKAFSILLTNLVSHKIQMTQPKFY